MYEKNSDIISSASAINQYRLHRGYHYPRSKITAYECLRSVKQFNTRFAHSIINGNTEHYYSIAKENSFINGGQYIKFLDEVEKIATSTLANSFLKDLNSIAVRPRDSANSIDLLSVLFAILILE